MRPSPGQARPLLLLLVLLSACGPRAPHKGPIVLITFDSLRADAVEALGGEPGLTPRLDELVREADWAGTAIASSSWESPTLASLFTGLRPWQHQVVHQGHARLSPALITLAEALKAVGYATAGTWSDEWYDPRFGFNQGFDVYQHYGKGIRIAERLREMRNTRQFVWAHLPAPAAPYLQRTELLPRLGRMPPQLPRKVLPVQLERWFDPANPLPRSQRRRFWAMYCLNVAWGDEQLGRLVDALRASGEWDRTLLVVTSNHGEEFGEHGQILHGGNLGRQLIEVPLIVKLPAGFERGIRVPKRQRVAAARLWATVVEAAGGAIPPAAAPSLFRNAAVPAVSELYLTNGTNRFSLVEGDLQLLWSSRFAASEPDYYRARLPFRSREARVRNQPNPKAIIARLDKAFDAVPPLHGIGRPELSLERWADSGAQRVDDPAKAREMAQRLVRAWSAFVPEERPPMRESADWRGAAGDEGQRPQRPARPRKRERS